MSQIKTYYKSSGAHVSSSVCASVNFFDRALRKVKYYPTMHQWGGCLTPSEIVALVDAGAISSAYSEWEMKWVRDKLAKGESRPTWFYFTARKQLVPLLPKRDNKKVGTAEKL